MSQAQYEREYEAGRLDPNALYLTPDENVLYVTQIPDEEGNVSASHSATEIIDFIKSGGQAWFDLGGEDKFPVVTYIEVPADSRAVIFRHYYVDTPENIESYTIYDDKSIEYMDNYYALQHDLNGIRDYVITYNCTVPDYVNESAKYCVPVYFNWDEIADAIAHNRRVICKIKHDARSPRMCYEYILTRYDWEESEITFNNGELLMFSDGSLYFPPKIDDSSVIVTVNQETKKANYSSLQISQMAKNGVTVLLDPIGEGTNYYPLTAIEPGYALFSVQPYDTSEYTCYEIAEDCTVATYEHHMAEQNNNIYTTQLDVVDNTVSGDGIEFSASLMPDRLTLRQDGEGFYIMAAPNEFNESEDIDCAVAEFWGEMGDEGVILRRIASPKEESDAANKQYVDAQVENLQNQIGNIGTALDSILEIQNSLIGGGRA